MSSFLSAALAELKRKWSRVGLRRNLKKRTKQRSQALLDLGTGAWEHRIHPVGSEALQHSLQQLTSESTSLSQEQDQLQTDIDLHKKESLARRAQLDSRLQEARSARLEVEATVEQLRRAIAEQQAAAEQTQTRLTAIAVEQAALRSEAGPTQTPPPRDGSPPEQRQAQLEREARQLTTYLSQLNEYLRTVAPQLTSGEQKVKEAKGREEAVKAERAGTLDDDNRRRRELENMLRSYGTKQGGLTRSLNEEFVALGSLVMQSSIEDPRIAADVGRVNAADTEISNIQRSLSASLRRTEGMPGWTMPAFFGALLVIPLLGIVLAVVVHIGLGQWRQWTQLQQAQERARQSAPSRVSPYRNHSLDGHPAYKLADRLGRAREGRNVEVARAALVNMCRALNLGIYTSDGDQIVAGSERHDQDFFLYRFMQHILADSYTSHTVMAWNAHTRMLGQVLAAADKPAEFDRVFREALYRRYADAARNPDRPESYLPLLVDGLARRQAVPYSLDELRRRDTETLEVDDVQSFLLMLDFFVTPPEVQSAWFEDLSAQLIPVARAGSICDKIAGDGSKAAWGNGNQALADLLSYGEGAAKETAEAAGKANLIVGLVGDILILRGVQLDIEPTRGLLISLPHVEKSRSDKTLPTHSYTAVAAFESELAPEVAACGWLVGKQIPKDGPLENVEVTWEFEPSLGAKVMLHDASEFVANMRMLTGKEGRATITLRAMACPEPKGRVLADQHHRVSASGRFLTAEMPNPLSALGGLSVTMPISMLPGFYEVVTGGRRTYSTLDVGWHEKKPEDGQY